MKNSIFCEPFIIFKSLEDTNYLPRRNTAASHELFPVINRAWKERLVYVCLSGDKGTTRFV